MTTPSALRIFIERATLGVYQVARWGQEKKKSWPDWASSYSQFQAMSRGLHRSGGAGLVAADVFLALIGVVVRKRLTEFIDLALGFVSGNSVAFLDESDELVFLAAQHGHVVVGELAPF